MLNTILGTKVNMSQTFIGETRVPVTKLITGPCVVTHIKTKDKDGYWAVQIGFGAKKMKNTPKSMQGHLKTALDLSKSPTTPRFIREVRVKSEPSVKVGDIVKASDVLKKGDVVSVTGISKGKGFAGVVKRWKFGGGPKTHGQSNRHRSPGSIGQGTTPGRVWKGKKMGGRMGTDLINIKNLHVISIDDEKNEIALSGSIPGTKGSLIVIKKLAGGSLAELEEHTPEVEIKVEEEGAPEEKKAEAAAPAAPEAVEK